MTAVRLCLDDQAVTRSRDRVLSTARGWLGTPYRHQQSVKGVACDCLGLVRGVWREVVGPEPQSMPAYSRDWAEASNADPLLDAAIRWFVPAAGEFASGQLLLFRWRPGMAAKHLAIVSGANRMIHAYERHAVMESPLCPHWRRRIAGAFDFPPAVSAGNRNQ